MRSVLSTLFLALVAIAGAQSPDLINYQGVVRNSAGVPLANRTISLRFELKQGSPTGTVAFQEVHSPVTTNLLGLLNVQIGKVNSNQLAQVDWLSGPYFLVIAIDTAAGSSFTELGFQQLVSIPYAMNAKKAQDVPSTYSNNVLQIGSSTYTIGNSSTQYTAGTGIDITGATITNTAPDQTVTINSSGSNVQVSGTYPNFNVTSTATLPHNDVSLSISDGNTVNITPTISITGNVLTVGPSSNTVALPAASAPTIVGTG